jgi:mRNA interferase RelE/StbE
MKKTLKIVYLKKADKFLSKNSSKISKHTVDTLIIKSIEKIYIGEKTNIDLKKISSMTNYYRIRKGNIRIVFQLNELDELIVSIVETIGYRGDVYKK